MKNKTLTGKENYKYYLKVMRRYVSRDGEITAN